MIDKRLTVQPSTTIDMSLLSSYAATYLPTSTYMQSALVPAKGPVYVQAIDAMDMRGVDLLEEFDPQVLAHAIPWDSATTYRRCQVAHVLSWDVRPTLGRFQ